MKDIYACEDIYASFKDIHLVPPGKRVHFSATRFPISKNVMTGGIHIVCEKKDFIEI